MPDWAEPTILGAPRGARRQYRYGNLHIREYADEYAIHVDAVDPRKDKLGHLIRDAPEVLVGLGCGIAAGALAYKASAAGACGSSSRGGSGHAATATIALISAAAAALASGCASYAASREIKRRASGFWTDGRDQNGRRLLQG